MLSDHEYRQFCSAGSLLHLSRQKVMKIVELSSVSYARSTSPHTHSLCEREKRSKNTSAVNTQEVK